jgi:ABC-type sugar transport system substrate-binding protein
MHRRQATSLGRLILVAAAIAVLGLSATAAQGRSEQNQILIGIATYPTVAPTIADAVGGAQTKAKQLKAKLTFAFSPDVAGQADGIDNLIARKVDVIAINPNDSQAVGASVVKANQAGIPVIMWVGDNLGQGKTLSLVTSNEQQGGAKIGQWGFANLKGNGDVALIQGSKKHQAGLLRERGWRASLKRYPNIDVVAYGEANWERDQAYTLATNMYTANPDVDAVFAMWDEGAQAALSAAQAAGIKPKIMGYNGACETINSVWKGGVTATLYQGWRDMGAKVVEVAVAAAKGQKVKPVVAIPNFVVTKQLMQQVRAKKYPKATAGLRVDVTRAIAGKC